MSSTKTLQAAIDQGIEDGLLPADTLPAPSSERPWPVLLLTAVGAWFAAVPLLIAVGMLLGNIIQAGPGPYIVGGLALAAAIVVLRSTSVPLFVEQLALPALLVGAGTLGMGLYRDFDEWGSLPMLVLVLALAWLIPKAWLRQLLGVAACALAGHLLLPHWGEFWDRERSAEYLILHGLLGLWLVALWLQVRLPRIAAALESVSAGWLLAVLAGLVWLSGSTFMVGGVVGSSEAGDLFNWATGFDRHSWQAYTVQGGASGLVLCGAALGAMAWSTLRSWLPLAVALVLAGLAWFMPLLGAALLALMVCATSQRWRLAGACALVAAWIVGGFYYQLQWPLADKALLLLVAGVGLGALTWFCQRGAGLGTHATPAAAQAPALAQPSGGRWAMLAGTALTLLVANAAIWQKQDLITHGKPLYLELQPVDPRSLTQGDYMRLRFTSLEDRDLPLLEDLAGKRPHLVVQVDARGVGRVHGLQSPGNPLAADQMLLQLTPKNGSWTVVTDAWFFKEGTGERWQAAKYGEFRVASDGRALLVGMADGDLKAISASAADVR